MLLTLFANHPFLTSIIMSVLMVVYPLAQTVTQVAEGTQGTGLIETAITNGSIGVVLFVVWFLTFKSTQKQFEFALKQNQEQFEKALTQIERQHKESLEQNHKTIDRIFLMMDKDVEYKEILTGVLTEMKNSIKHLEGSKS